VKNWQQFSKAELLQKLTCRQGIIIMIFMTGSFDILNRKGCV